MENLGDGLKKVLLAGIGAIAVTGEKSQEVIESLVKKGEITVEQGKVLNQELKRNIKSKVDDAKDTVKNKKKEADANYDGKDISDILKDMSAEQIAQLKALLERIKSDDNVQKAAGFAEEVAGKAEEVAGEAADKAKEAAEKFKDAVDKTDEKE